MSRREIVLWWTLAAVLLLLSLSAFLKFVVMSPTSVHGAPPTPRGLVMRVEARALESPFDRVIVSAVDRDGPAILVESCEPGGTMLRRSTYRFPGGVLIETRLVPRPALQGVGEPGLSPSFDLDGDGCADRIDVLQRGLLRVVSSCDSRVLFEDSDPLEYEGLDRVFPLPDLDGDGHSELALVHPRLSIEIWDQILGARSWITIVSGREATR